MVGPNCPDIRKMVVNRLVLDEKGYVHNNIRYQVDDRLWWVLARPLCGINAQISLWLKTEN